MGSQVIADQDFCPQLVLSIGQENFDEPILKVLLSNHSLYRDCDQTVASVNHAETTTTIEIRVTQLSNALT